MRGDLQDLMQRLSKALLRNWFSQDQVDVFVFFSLRRQFVRCSHENYRLAAAHLFECGRELQPIHARHRVIGQEKIEIFRLAH